jgi:hypothetical protein
MNTVLEARVRAAGAEMTKPGRWRVALEQLDQAAGQILAAPEVDKPVAQLTLENLQGLYQWASVMSSQELRQLNTAIIQLSTAIQE